MYHNKGTLGKSAPKTGVKEFARVVNKRKREVIMNNFKVKCPRTDLEFEIAFTKAYREAVRRYTHPAQIELACLRAQYPAILHPIQEEDVIAGRVQAGLVGLGIQGQTGGYGYYIDEPRVTEALERAEGNARYREDIHDLLIFWKTNSSYNKVLRNAPDSVRPVLFSDNWKETPLPASPIIRMAGAYLDFDKLIALGLPGMEEEAKAYAKKAEEQGGDVILYECMYGALKLMEEVCLWYQKQARELAETAPGGKRRTQLEKMAAALENIACKAPSSMLEALQLVWIYGIMSPLLQFGRMDEYLGDWYVHDIDNGIITEEEALEMLQSYFRQIDSLDSETDCRVIVGGYGRRNPENADRLCLVAAEACRTVKEILPQFTLRFNKETPKAVWDACMKCIEEGRTYPLLYNDDVLVPGVMKAFHVDRKLAETYMPLDCGEIEFDHYSFGTPSGSLNTLKILELSVRGGYEPIMDWKIGKQLKPLEECETYEEFLEIYKENLRYYIEAQAIYEKYEYQMTGKMHSFLYVSMLYDGVMESGKAIFDGGCQYLAGTLELYGVVNAVNSLAAIRKLVFEDKTVSARDLRAACTGCRECIPVCPQNASYVATDGDRLRISVDYEKCTACGACTQVCCYDARSVIGRDYTAEELKELIRTDLDYYKIPDQEGQTGGITLTGGEPMSQFPFIDSLLHGLEGVHVCMETCGYAPAWQFEKLLGRVDQFLFDYKVTDSKKHRELCGRDNRLILKNLQLLCDRGQDMVLRLPMIPGINDDACHFKAIAEIINHNPNIRRGEIMAYHNMGIAKAEQIGLDGRAQIRRYDGAGATQEQKEEWLERFKRLGLRQSETEAADLFPGSFRDRQLRCGVG